MYPVSDVNNTPERIQDADIIIVNKVPMNEKTLKDANSVKLICVTATGVDNIDFTYTNQRGIVVTNVKDYCTAVITSYSIHYTKLYEYYESQR